MPQPEVSGITPRHAVAGGRLVVRGHGFPVDDPPPVTFNETPGQVAFVSDTRMVVVVPEELEGGDTLLRVDQMAGLPPVVAIGAPWATGLHQVDSPVFDASGRLYVTYSGSRGQEAPVSIFRVDASGTREPFASGITNPTSMTVGPDGDLYVSSRFEGEVRRVAADGTHERAAGELGVACGVAFDADGWMYVGDRSGTIFRVRDGRGTAFATLPASVAAFHLAIGPDGDLFVTAPTLGTCDAIYRIGRTGEVQPLPVSFGRPQGLAFGPDGALYVAEALAGASGLYRVPLDGGEPRLVIAAGASLVGVAFGPEGECVVASSDTAYRFERLDP
jgi:sugar lactone lactonase YvrE